MAVENVNHIGDLDPTNPSGASPKSEGDDNIRAIKKGIKNSFAGFLGAVLITGVDGGAANAYTLAPATQLAAYSPRMLVVFAPLATNTGECTLNISGLGAKPVVSVSNAPLRAGDLAAGRIYTVFWDGTKFRLDSITQNYVDQLVISASVPGVDDPANAGKVFGSNGTNGQWVSLDSRGDPIFDNGNASTGTVVIDFKKGDGQKIKATGAHTLTVTGFPTGRIAGILLELTNYGAYPPVTTGIIWIKSDGTETATFSSSGITFPASGRARVVLFSFGDGVVYGRAA